MSDIQTTGTVWRGSHGHRISWADRSVMGSSPSRLSHLGARRVTRGIMCRRSTTPTRLRRSAELDEQKRRTVAIPGRAVGLVSLSRGYLSGGCSQRHRRLPSRLESWRKAVFAPWYLKPISHLKAYSAAADKRARPCVAERFIKPIQYLAELGLTCEHSPKWMNANDWPTPVWDSVITAAGAMALRVASRLSKCVGQRGWWDR